MSDRNRGYDYNHSTMNFQFLAIIILVIAGCLGGLALALFGFGLLT